MLPAISRLRLIWQSPTSTVTMPAEDWFSSTLAYADVGIAMGGSRTDIAMEAADITVTGDDPLMIPAVLRLAHRTMQTIRQNFAAAVGVNTLGLVLASTGVLPVAGGVAA
jgi:cation transport ATPase